jgi:hypothetical protein
MLPHIAGLWIGPRLSAVERLCIRSFQAHGHNFVLYAYDDIADVPPGTEVRDANEVIPASETRPFIERGNIANFADWFRWELLRNKGGYWVDMDMVCLAPFDFSEPVIFGWQQDNVSATGVLRFPVGHPALDEMVDRSLHPNRIRSGDSKPRKLKKLVRKLLGNSRARISWAEAGGPNGFRSVIKSHDLTRFGQPYTVFYPVYHTQFWSMFDDTFADDTRFFKRTRAIHLWNEVGKRYFNWDKDATYHPNSLIEQLKRRYGI